MILRCPLMPRLAAARKYARTLTVSERERTGARDGESARERGEREGEWVG